MTRGAGGRPAARWRAAGLLLVVLLTLAGAGLIGLAVTAPGSVAPPQPAAGDPYVPPPVPPPLTPLPNAADPDLTGIDRPALSGLPRSAPVQVAIERIGVRAEVLALGTRDDGTVEVPPLSRAQLAGWYSRGPSPGEVGNAMLMGHVDSATLGPAVFFRLGELAAGDRILVTRQDRSVVAFRVDGVRSYPKTAFPTALVYGPSDQAGLRLVTCGGTFDRRRGSYPNNIVVFATRV